MSKNVTSKSDQLLEQFVARFEESGIWTGYEGDLVFRHDSDSSALSKLYSRLPAKFPPLYERLVLTYRWHRVSVRDDIELFGNWPGEKFERLLDEIFRDKGLMQACLPNGFIQFGSGPAWYDPLCFDTSNSTGDGDFAIVQIDHEEILCNSRIKVVQKIAPTFEQFILDIIG